MLKSLLLFKTINGSFHMVWYGMVWYGMVWCGVYFFAQKSPGHLNKWYTTTPILLGQLPFLY